MASSDGTLYCLCRQPYDEKLFMIECDVCKDWFHGKCVNIQEHQASDIELYHCPKCQPLRGPLLLKRRRNWHRHDYTEDDEDTSKGVQTGTVVFVKELKSRTFPSAEEIPIVKLQGHELTQKYLEKNDFDVPVLVERKEGLGMTIPPSNFTVQDVENYIGPMREIDVIDVSRQEDYKMLLREWTEYYNSPNRQKIFNVISLEFSNTRLSELVVPPQLVRELSWAHNLWPEQVPEDSTLPKPEVQKYCLMGVKDSYTDFHIDFGGSSVWYHVFKGEKIFYLIRPTPANLILYENWLSSSNQSEMFFGDQADVCYKCVVRQGQTLFIPTGWIHAVFTPIDSLVFGGNFLHSFNIGLQLQVYEIERRVKTPRKYMYPMFETIHWYAARHIQEQLKDLNEEGKKPSEHLLQGAKALVQHLKGWTQKKENVKSHLDHVPEQIQYGKLIKELAKEIKHSEKPGTGKTRSQGRKKRKTKQMAHLDVLEKHTHEKLQELQTQPDLPANPSLKVRLPKFGAYTAPPATSEKDAGTTLRLKVSNGKIVSGASGGSGAPGKFQPLAKEEEDSDEDNLVVDENPAASSRSGGLKLKLSFTNKSLQELSGSSHLAPQEAEKTKPKDEVTSPERTDIPTIRGGLNGSIADILEASGYGTETDFKVDQEHLGSQSASPTMRDAIQGMLSMSRIGGLQLGGSANLSGHPLVMSDKRRKKGRIFSDDTGEKMNTCFKDEEYVYPTLDLSEDEDEYVFKPRGRQKKDETWNPKARLAPNCPKPERPPREGTRRESVESGLAAAAAKLAQKPKQKRQYIRKKPRLDKSLSQSHSGFHYEDAQPGPSGVNLSISAPASVLQSGIKRGGEPMSPTKAAKKPKKGLATAKQRLGKILKIHKIIH